MHREFAGALFAFTEMETVTSGLRSKGMNGSQKGVATG